MRKKIIAGNWKMNLHTDDTQKILEDLLKLDLTSDVDVLICPPFTSLAKASEILENTSINLGAQNVSEFEDGAYTGEISTGMLKNLGVTYVILGHSERRGYFGENDKIVNAKIKRALAQNLKVILCLGEDKNQRENQRHEEVVREELKKSLEGVESLENLAIAYEPIWAIGTGKTCSSKDAQSMCSYIRELITSIYGNEIGEKIRILYGGSVKPENVKEILDNKDIDGALVGGASLKSFDFSKLVNYGVK